MRRGRNTRRRAWTGRRRRGRRDPQFHALGKRVLGGGFVGHRGGDDGDLPQAPVPVSGTVAASSDAAVMRSFSARMSSGRECRYPIPPHNAAPAMKWSHPARARPSATVSRASCPAGNVERDDIVAPGHQFGGDIAPYEPRGSGDQDSTRSPGAGTSSPGICAADPRRPRLVHIHGDHLAGSGVVLAVDVAGTGPDPLPLVAGHLGVAGDRQLLPLALDAAEPSQVPPAFTTGYP